MSYFTTFIENNCDNLFINNSVNIRTLMTFMNSYGIRIKWNDSVIMFNYDENVSVGSANTLYNYANGLIISRTCELSNDETSDVPLPKLKLLYYGYPRVVCLSAVPQSDDFTYYKTQDGTLIRLFYNNNQWCVATNMHPDASKSKFRNDSTFYDLFMETATAVGMQFDTLNKEHCYTLLMINPNNDTVFTHTEHKLIHLCTYSLTDKMELFDNTCITSNGVIPNGITPMECTTLNDIELTVVPNANLTGYLLIQNGVRYRIDIPVYRLMKQMRGHCENPVVQILELHSTGQLETFIKCYPNQQELVNHTLIRFNECVESLLNAYVNYYIVKKVNVLHSDTNCRSLLYSLHQQYKASKGVQPFKVNYKSVREKLMSMSPDTQYALITSVQYIKC